MSSSNGG
jgi:hypothetical protein